ncbi:MAG: hypothetical protein ACLR13_10635 [Acutalibacteraceae bacterium]
MSIEERGDVMEQIHMGKNRYYILHQNTADNTFTVIFGRRQVGMVVIDEAHTVTSWGRDFRSDYYSLVIFETDCS